MITRSLKFDISFYNKVVFHSMLPDARIVEEDIFYFYF